MQYRSGEDSNKHFRAGRFFCVSGQWYFSTRENLQVGPFSLREDAEIELMFYLRHLNEGGIYANNRAMMEPVEGYSETMHF